MSSPSASAVQDLPTLGGAAGKVTLSQTVRGTAYRGGGKAVPISSVALNGVRGEAGTAAMRVRHAGAHLTRRPRGIVDVVTRPLSYRAALREEGATLDPFLLRWAEGTLRAALSRSPLFDARPYEIFTQGSRVNGTALDLGSDIDLVLMLKADAGGGWEVFRDDVLAALGESYVVRRGRRCVNVDDPDSLFAEMVDILVVTEYRLGDEQGVFFRDLQGRPIVNFPKQHRYNGDAKDLRTDGHFKQAVRSAKRVRRLAEQERMIATGAAPSYLLECLLYNVPDDVYLPSPDGALEWLNRCYREDPVAFSGLPCQNGINRLFGPGPDQWEPEAAGRIVDVLHQIRSVLELPGGVPA